MDKRKTYYRVYDDEGREIMVVSFQELIGLWEVSRSTAFRYLKKGINGLTFKKLDQDEVLKALLQQKRSDA